MASQRVLNVITENLTYILRGLFLHEVLAKLDIGFLQDWIFLTADFNCDFLNVRYFCHNTQSAASFTILILPEERKKDKTEFFLEVYIRAVYNLTKPSLDGIRTTTI